MESTALKRVAEIEAPVNVQSKKQRTSPPLAHPQETGSSQDPTHSPAFVGKAGSDANPEESGSKKQKVKVFDKRRDSIGYVRTTRPKGEKEKKKTGRRRRGTRNQEGESAEGAHVEGGSDTAKAPRLPKRQCALLIGFCGSGYSGMQIQPDHSRTIEGVLFQAMVRAGAVSQDNADDPVKVSLARAARTDAGVHAAGNLVSLKMIMHVPGVPDLVARINEELPPEIRLWGYVRVQNSFNARMVCDSRKYTYFFPSYLLLPPKPGSGLGHILRERDGMSETGMAGDASFWSEEPPSREAELAKKRAWRASPKHISRLREIARKYEGTHNFHNFTVSREFGDRSNQRHMKKIEIAEPQVYGDTEWISVLFHGQSFMLHQRKMMTALVMSCRTGTPEHLIDELYGPRSVFIPKMPSLGLLLEEPIFDSYNTRMAAVNEKLQPSDPDYRPSISFDAHRQSINAFKEKYIYNNMRKIEDRYGLFDAWIRAVDSYSGKDLSYLNSRGIIPPEAVINKGERRENPFREKKKFDATSFAMDDSEKAKRFEEEDEDEDELTISKQHLAESEG